MQDRERASRAHDSDREQQRLVGALTDSAAELHVRLSTRPWWEVADALALVIATTTQLCAIRALPIAEIKALWLTHLRVLEIIQEREAEWKPCQKARLPWIWKKVDQQLRDLGVNSPQERQRILKRADWFHREEMRGLQRAIQVFAGAFYGRKSNSPQARFAEARLSCQRALMEKPSPLLHGLPKLVETLRKVCSHEAYSYMAEDVVLEPDKFLDMLHVVAHDEADAAEMANPPARIRAALARKQRRKEWIDRKRWMQMTPEQIASLEDPRQFESGAIAKVDWEHARRDVKLPEDQARAVEARIEGVDLEGAEAPDYLDLDPGRTETVRRSLEPDRRWGRKLRQRLSAYDARRSPGG